MPVERNCLIVFRMDRERSHPDHIRDLQRSPQCIEQQPGTYAAALPIGMNSETREHQQWNWMARHSLDDSLGGIAVTDFAGDDRIKPHDLLSAQPDVCLGRVCLLGLKRMPNQEPVELRLPAREILDGVSAV